MSVPRPAGMLLLGLACVLGSMVSSASSPARADTPSDTLVQAGTIGDVLSLDPAEVFEFTASEVLASVYRGLVSYDVDDVSQIVGAVAERWTVSEDGTVFAFTIRPGQRFASGNPVTADDAVFSLRRAVTLDKAPAFLLNQLGLTADNATRTIRRTGPMTLEIETDRAYAPTLVLYCLTATVGLVVDAERVRARARDGDRGNAWLRRHSAGSGPFAVRDWRANEILVLDRNPNHAGEAPAMERVIYRHVPETATRRLLLERGDIDIARDVGTDEIDALRANPDIAVDDGVKGAIYYLGLNQRNEYLAHPEVRQAMKHLVDYSAIADTVMRGKVRVHQAFLPVGFLGALEETPFELDVPAAKALLAKAGLPEGFAVTMDVTSSPSSVAIAQAIRQSMALAGIELKLILGDDRQALTKYRARKHDVYLGRWGPDYQDPHANADTFARNPDNADDAAFRPLAWRNAWEIPDMTARADAAMLESDPDVRAAMYVELQREHQRTSPFVILFQDIEVLARRTKVRGFVIGPSFGDNSFERVVKVR